MKLSSISMNASAIVAQPPLLQRCVRCWRNLIIVIALSLSFGMATLADTLSFGITLGGGGPTYQTQFAGQQFASNKVDNCKSYMGPHGGGSGTLDYSLFTVYPFTASSSASFCLMQLYISGLPSCYSAYVDDVPGGYPVFSDIYVDGPPGKSSYSHQIKIMPTGSVKPIAVWDVGASTNGYYVLPADGASTAVGTIKNTDYTTYPVTFSFAGKSLGCTLTHTNAGQVILQAGTNYGTVEVVAQTDDPNKPLKYGCFLNRALFHG